YDEIKNNNIPLIHLSEKGLLSKVKKFRQLLDEFRPDVVHSILFDSNIISRLASIGRNEIIVESLVNKTYSEDREFRSKTLRVKNSIIKLVDKNTSFLVDHFHSVGHSVV